MHDEIGGVEPGFEEFLVAGYFQALRHDAIRRGQHAIGGHDGVSDKTKRTHDLTREPDALLGDVAHNR